MREIKFEYGFESINGIVKKKYYLHEIPFLREKCDVWNILPLAYVRRFTGLLDKKGVEIYEGDKCYFEIKGLGSGNAECYFVHGCFFLKVEGQKEPFPLFNYEHRDDIIIEVIDNPYQVSKK